MQTILIMRCVIHQQITPLYVPFDCDVLTLYARFSKCLKVVPPVQMTNVFIKSDICPALILTFNLQSMAEAQIFIDNIQSIKHASGLPIH